MSTTTSNLGLFKYDTTLDGRVTFSINRSLNNNWDVLDNAFGDIKYLFNRNFEVLPTYGNVYPQVNKLYTLTPTNNVSINLPNVTTGTKPAILIQLNLYAQYSIYLGTERHFIGVNGDVQDITTGIYTLYYEWSDVLNSWIWGIIKVSGVL